ncbi:MAG: response regulator [Bacteroidota bacterium]
MKKLNCILLIDDNELDNFYHERVLRKSNSTENVVTKESATAALDFLKAKDNHLDLHPDLIFLDINMPGMNGWEFLEEYDKLNPDLKGKIIIVMLTTSTNPEDEMRAHNIKSLSGYLTKPLMEEKIKDIIEQYFS